MLNVGFKLKGWGASVFLVDDHYRMIFLRETPTPIINPITEKKE